MPRKGIFYFATKADMESGLEKIESEVSIKYTRLGLFDSPETTEYKTYKDFPDFGLSTQGTTNSQPIYLIYPSDFKVVPKEVPQRRGGIKYSVNDMNKQMEICFRFVPSGEYEEAYLIPGEFSPGISDFSTSLYKTFRKVFLKNFKKVKSYSVGPEAYQKFESGIPLTPSYKAKPEMYLQC
ncbi:hypothetical protein CLV44_1056 [Marinobacterium halophilum]|uniref:Uncharacterized protein n=1 Tax=Marinobacterium halophilum TaxID=267374 RepID=A0A2P8F059_9GAMM|nr:hypothetical protein [Marinobacterium halophilum]PSL15112.1 hypothetical protein CLV44_1056 [Marinobacterium halophilum]